MALGACDIAQLTTGLLTAGLGLPLSTATDFAAKTQHALHTHRRPSPEPDEGDTLEELNQKACFHGGGVL